MHLSWVTAGLDPARFWVLTMREIDREFSGAVKIRARETNERIWLAWHIVALDRTEKLPKLDSLMQSDVQKVRQTPDQMLVAMKSIFLAFGGNPQELGLKQ